MITKESKKYLKKLEKKEEKAYLKLIGILQEMKDNGMYGGLSLEYAERDLNNFDDWFAKTISTMRKFAANFDEYNVKEETES